MHNTTSKEASGAGMPCHTSATTEAIRWWARAARFAAARETSSATPRADGRPSTSSAR